MARSKMTITDPEAGTRKKKIPKVFVAAIVFAILLIIVVAAYFIVTGKKRPAELIPPDPEAPLPPSPSVYHFFKRAAVCTDGPPCSAIGKEILEKNGSAVDATIAAMFCNGLVNMQSMGLGGGFMMTIYTRSNGSAVTLNAREAAPIMAHRDMFENNTDASWKGPLSIAVPGEVKGYWVAHQRFGSLPWGTLLEPSIRLCETGFNISKVLWDGVSTSEYIMTNPYLKEMFYDSANQNLRKGGTLVYPSKTLCATLRTLAEKGGEDLYSGELADRLAEDFRVAGSIITKEDLLQYEAKWHDPIKIDITNDDTLFTLRPPGGGAVMGLILQILKGYNFNNESIHGLNKTILTYHRVVEAFKYAFAKRTLLGDADFVDLDSLINNITNPNYGEQLRLQINDSKTYSNASHYGAEYHMSPDHGTAHVSVIAPNGDAVSVTSSINFYFGSGISGNSTGILFNNVMNDFSIPGAKSYFGVPPSPSNEIRPRKRPLSSFSPSIIVDGKGEVKMVIGAAGGTRIGTAVASVIMRNLWFKQTIKESVDAPRIHHQLTPMSINYEYGNLKQVIRGLQKLGHNTTRYRDRGSIICALFRNQTGIYANADYRKGGDVFGM